MNRRHFGRAAATAIVASFTPLRAARALRRANEHPAPRPGITASKVATRQQLGGKKSLVELFDSVREIPEVVDGIRCQCGCATYDGFYSLLTCYEGANAMAKTCPVCQGEGRMAARLHKEGKSLDEIRQAIDAKFG